MDKNFIRVRSTKDITISGTLTIAGCILVALPTATSINILGFFMIFAGIILILMMKTGWKDAESGLKYNKKERFFAQNMHNEIAERIASKPSSVNLQEEDKGNAIRLDIYYSKQGGKAYIQLFEYIPYKYEPCTRQYEYEIAEAEKLIG